MFRISKKLREYHQFEIFRKICGSGPSGMACVQELPDFVVRQGGGYIGIELTQYFKPTVHGRRPLQEQHSLQAMLVDRAKHLFEETTGDRLRVDVLFRPRISIDKRQAIELASTLAGFVQNCAITDIHQRFDPWHAGPGLRPVAAVYARKCNVGLRSLWRIATAGAVRPLMPADIQATIASKEADIPRYDRRATENWLVIILDGSAASFAELTESARVSEYRTAFNQLHLLDIAGNRCTDLTVAVA